MAGGESVCERGDDGSVADDFVDNTGAFCPGSPSKETGMDDSAGKEPGGAITKQIYKNMKRTLAAIMFALVSFGAEKAEVKNISVNGGIEDGRARLVIEAALHGLGTEREKLIYTTALDHVVRITREKQTHTIHANFEILQGEAKEIALTISGEGEIKSVTG